MTLKEKLKTEFPINTEKKSNKFANKCVEIASEFAIEFHRWMIKNDTIDNADKYFHHTDKDMLEEFKKEKEL